MQVIFIVSYFTVIYCFLLTHLMRNTFGFRGNIHELGLGGPVMIFILGLACGIVALHLTLNIVKFLRI